MRYGGLIIAIAFAAVAAVIVLRMMSNEQKAPAAQAQGSEQVKTVNVYVAAKPIPIGVAITPDMIVAQPWPEHLVLDGFIRDESGKASDGGPVGANAVVGMVTRAPFQQQEPILSTKLANPNDPNFLAAELPKGMRVITIQTNETQGVAGFVFPGDHVDVMVTHLVDKMVNGLPHADGTTGAPQMEKDSVTETVLTNTKVMAVDQHSTNVGSTDAEGKLLVPRSVTLMVSPADAQRLRLAEKLGTLTLDLRSLADRDSADPLILTQQGDVSQYKSAAAVGGATESVTVYHGVTRDATPVGVIPAAQPMPTGTTPTPRAIQ
jgi:pilus assembly protein CpaB